MPKFEKYGKCLGILANTTSKCTCIMKILPYVRVMPSWSKSAEKKKRKRPEWTYKAPMELKINTHTE